MAISDIRNISFESKKVGFKGKDAGVLEIQERQKRFDAVQTIMRNLFDTITKDGDTFRQVLMSSMNAGR